MYPISRNPVTSSGPKAAAVSVEENPRNCLYNIINNVFTACNAQQNTVAVPIANIVEGRIVSIETSFSEDHYILRITSMLLRECSRYFEIPDSEAMLVEDRALNEFFCEHVFKICKSLQQKYPKEYAIFMSRAPQFLTVIFSELFALKEVYGSSEWTHIPGMYAIWTSIYTGLPDTINAETMQLLKNLTAISWAKALRFCVSQKDLFTFTEMLEIYFETLKAEFDNLSSEDLDKCANEVKKTLLKMVSVYTIFFGNLGEYTSALRGDFFFRLYPEKVRDSSLKDYKDPLLDIASLFIKEIITILPEETLKEIFLYLLPDRRSRPSAEESIPVPPHNYFSWIQKVRWTLPLSSEEESFLSRMALSSGSKIPDDYVVDFGFLTIEQQRYLAAMEDLGIPLSQQEKLDLLKIHPDFYLENFGRLSERQANLLRESGYQSVDPEEKLAFLLSLSEEPYVEIDTGTVEGRIKSKSLGKLQENNAYLVGFGPLTIAQRSYLATMEEKEGRLTQKQQVSLLKAHPSFYLEGFGCLTEEQASILESFADSGLTQEDKIELLKNFEEVDSLNSFAFTQEFKSDGATE